jgi:hypothetical protein
MTVVVGTAGHIDHGKTTLLRALTGIDADRLPEEQRRGMTIDVGYAHLDLDDGSVIDFVDVPGHDRLVGNMLVGTGEIDAALLVVAADDGPRAQTLEHLALLDGLGITNGIVAVTSLWADEQLYFPLHVEPYEPAERLPQGKKDPVFHTKPQIGMALVEAARALGLPFRAVIADCTYGESAAFEGALRVWTPK